MARFRFSMLIVILTIVSFLIGCSGGGGSSPVAPDKTSGSMDSIPIIGMSEANGTYNAIGLFGAYEMILNPDLSAELISKRVGAIGEDYIVSGIAFFTIAPCPQCLKITGVELTLEGDAKLTFAINHPFPKGNTSENPSALNRLDLDVFDLAMVIVPTGATAVPYTLTGESVYTDTCVGADGFTTELANVVSDDAAMPYFLVIDDSDTGTSTWNKFEMEASASFDVVFNLSGTSLAFDMYLTMGYGFSAKKLNRLDPKYYNPEFNRKAAWKVAVTPPEGVDPPAMFNTWDDSDIATTYDVTVSVYDWQIGATVSTEADFGDADPGDVFAASEPSGVTVEIPGMNTAIQTLAVPDNPTGTGGPADPWIYTLPIANELQLVAGEYLGLVVVTDERAVLTPGDGRDFIIDTENGIDLDNYEIPGYVTYQTFTATVVVGCGPITGTIDTPVCPVTDAFTGEIINFTCTAASGNGGDPIVLYEWDADYDGFTFDVDATGDDVCLGPFLCDAGNPATYTVAVRATDSCGPPANVTVFATCEVTVSDCTDQQIVSVAYVAKDGEDELFDIGVEPAGYVYVLANHVALGLVDDTRTAVRWDNDLTNFTVMATQASPTDPRVINAGLNNPPGYGYDANPVPWGPTYVSHIDVLGNGDVAVDTGNRAFGLFNVSTDPIVELLCCGRIRCTDYADAFLDVWDLDDGGSYADKCAVGLQDIGLDCFASQGDLLYTCWIHEDGVYASWPIVWGGGASGFQNIMNVWDATTSEYSVVGVDGLHGTENSMFFISDSINGYLSDSGTVVSNYNSPPANPLVENARYGTYGTGDGEFMGGLDITIDNLGNIITLEQHGCMYRFQKFDSLVTWQYSSWWTGTGNPMRIDFDTNDNELFLLCDTGVHKVTVP